MLIAWSWSQWAHEGGIVAAAIIASACLAYLARKGAAASRARDLRIRGIATGINPKGVREPPKRRFSLLDLLVVVTLVAAVIGAFNGIRNEEKKGIPFEIVDPTMNDWQNKDNNSPRSKN